MKDLVDYIKYHGYITSIRDKVDKDYIWFSRLYIISWIYNKY